MGRETMSMIHREHDCNAYGINGHTPCGSIWQCNECGRYWIVSWLFEAWVAVRWYHFRAKGIIAKAARDD